MRKLTQLLNDLRARGGKLDPRRPSGIVFGHDGDARPEGTKLFVNIGPRLKEEEAALDEETQVLLGKVECARGPGELPMDIDSVRARWIAAGRALPGESRLCSVKNGFALCETET